MSVHRERDTSGVYDDAETQAYLRHLSEKCPSVGVIIQGILETLQFQANKTSSHDCEYDFHLAGMKHKYNPLQNDEESDTSKLYYWGKGSPTLRQNRGTYRSRIVR